MSSNQFTLDPNMVTGQTFTVQPGVYSLSISDANSSVGFRGLYFLTLNDQFASVKIFVHSPGSFKETVTVSVNDFKSNFIVNFNQYPMNFDPSVVFTYTFNLTPI